MSPTTTQPPSRASDSRSLRSCSDWEPDAGRDLVRLRWPDGVMQCELNIAGDQKIKLAENNRKTGSCPGPFHLERPAVRLHRRLPGRRRAGLPDRARAFTASPIATSPSPSRPSNCGTIDGVFRLSVTEPMDEIAYLDHLRLDVVDRPPGVSSTPDERFAPEGPRPTGEVIAWRTAIEPVRATDLAGRDLTETLRHWDRRTADGFRKRGGWIGYAEEHGIILDFGDRLSQYSSRPTGWCFAWPAGSNILIPRPTMRPRRPASCFSRRAIERQRRRRPVADHRAARRLPRRHAPAHDPRPDRQADRPAVRAADQDQHGMLLRPGVHRGARPGRGAVAAGRRACRSARACSATAATPARSRPTAGSPCFTTTTTSTPRRLARFSGKLTRYGDVAPLLRDRRRPALPGRARATKSSSSSTRRALPVCRPGWTRSYVLRGYGYCKDADPFTALERHGRSAAVAGHARVPVRREVRRPADPVL